MAKIVDYGTYIIDLADAMIEHQQGLTKQHLSHLAVIRDRSVRFVTSCIQHESADLETLYLYLDGEAMNSIKYVINYSEHLIMDESLHPTYADAVSRIKECGFSIREELKQMKDDLIEFMGKIGLSVPSPQKEISAKKPIQRLQAKRPALQVDYLDDDVAAVPDQVARKPLKRLQPQGTNNRQPVRRIQHAQPVTESRIRHLQPQG